MRFAKALVRPVLSLPWLAAIVLLSPVVLVIAAALAVQSGYRKLELWAVYDGDEDAREKDKWRDR